MARICVFGGSRSGNHGEFAAAAELLGVCFAKSGHTLVYGGSGTGIMGILADAVLRNGGNGLV